MCWFSLRLSVNSPFSAKNEPCKEHKSFQGGLVWNTRAEPAGGGADGGSQGAVTSRQGEVRLKFPLLDRAQGRKVVSLEAA